MPFFTSFLHTLVVYTVVGGAVALTLSLAACAVFKIGRPLVKRKFYFLVLIIPLLAYLFHYFISPALQLEHGAKFFEPSNRIFAYLCSLGVLGSTYYLPLLLLVAFGVYRAGTYYLHRREIALRTLERSSRLYAEPEKILQGLAEKAGLKVPALQILKGPGYSCFTYGLFQPVIALSDKWLDFLDQEELEAVLAHELGHIAHRDSLFNLLAVVLRDISIYLPAAHLALRRLQSEQEFAADDFAVDITGKPLIYSATLLKAWRKSRERWAPQISHVPAFTAEARISDRVERIMRGNPGNQQGSGQWLLITIGILTIALLAYAC